MEDLGNNNVVSQYIDHQCALWSCRQIFLDGNRYCSVAHEQRADHDVDVPTPHSFLDVYSHGELERYVLPKVTSLLLNGNANPGIVDLSHDTDILTVGPWNLQDHFDTNLEPREDFTIWLFVGMFTPDPDVWRPGTSAYVMGRIVRRIYRPLHPIANGSVWILHRYILNNHADRALYTMQYFKPPVPPQPVIAAYYNNPDDDDDGDDDDDDDDDRMEEPPRKVKHGRNCENPEVLKTKAGGSTSYNIQRISGNGKRQKGTISKGSDIERNNNVLMEKKTRESLWKDEDDEGLGRDVERMNLGLQNLKKKIKLLVDMKSSKILTSVSKEIQMGLDSQTTGKRSDGESGSSHHDFEGLFKSEMSKAMKKIRYLHISSVVLLEKVKTTVEACLESSVF
ncbi:unnamed protein product [Arabidopsis lyrata]|nr:unnamed protein product [Arabidopsis lyrata]